MTEQTTILTVSYNSWDYLLLNHQLSIKTNSEDLKWIIINNRPEDESEKKESYYELKKQKNIKIINGINRDLLYKKLGVSRARPQAFHHAYALNIGIQYCKTDYLVVLDPDFYIIRKDWSKEVREFTKENNIIFFGATWTKPYTEKLTTKWTDFPCSHMQHINLSKIDRKILNFLPKENDDYSSLAKDTGCRVRDEALKSYSSSQIYIIDSCTRLDFFSARPIYFPQKPPRVKAKGREFGLKSIRHIYNSMDYFLWMDSRFGFHMRNFPKGLTNLDNLKEFNSEYVINCMRYLTLDVFP